MHCNDRGKKKNITGRRGAVNNFLPKPPHLPLLYAKNRVAESECRPGVLKPPCVQTNTGVYTDIEPTRRDM